MKLDMGQAWNAATAMLAANRGIVVAIAGVFIFLPYLVLALFLPQAVQGPAETADPEVMMAMMQDLYLNNWWAFLLVTVIQGIGMIALLILLTDRRRPTVGEALAKGATGFITYILAQILTGFMIALLIVFPIVAAVGSVTVAVIVGLVAAVAAVYLAIKFSLSAPVVAIEGERNPVQALRRSWQITKGNSLRLLAFYILLMIAMGVVLVLFTMIFGVVFAAVGGVVEEIGIAVVSSLGNSVFAVIFLAVLAAIHRQLAGPGTEEVSETFE